MKRVIGFILALVLLYASVAGVGEVREKEVEKNAQFKLKWTIMNRIRKIKAFFKRMKIRIPWKFKINRMLAPVIMSVDAVFKGMSQDAIEWAQGIDCKGGCWHSEEDGSKYSSYQSAVYSEAWGSDVTKSFDVTQLQSIVTNFTPSNTAGSILLKRSTNTIFTILFSGGNISVNGGATIDTYTPDTEITLEMIPDFNNEAVVIYIDGNLLSKEDFATGEHCNQLDEIARSGTQTAVGDIFIADTVQNSKVLFSDTLNEDTLSDYTLGGDTNPTYDSTEKAIELRDVTNLANQTSIAYQDFDCTQDDIEFPFTLKIGTNDSSTDGRVFDIRLRSKADTDTYLAVYYNGANIFLENVVDGAVGGTGNTAIALGNTAHDFKVISQMNAGHIYLFIDDVEYLDVVPTKLKRFYDGQGHFQSQHDAGEESEIFIKNILVEHSPLVVAPRSTPPGLLTSAIRPAVEGTYWDDLAGGWSTGCAVEGTTGVIYGNGIKDAAVADNGYIELALDTVKDFSNIHTMDLYLYISNAGDFKVGLEDSSTNESLSATTMTASKRTHISELLSGLTGSCDLTDVKKIIIKNESGGVSDITVSGFQLLGGPEHDVRGQPLYASSGIDDIDEWDDSDSTTVVPIWDAGGFYDLDDATNGANEVCSMKRGLNFNPNGVGHLHWEAEILATDTSTDFYWNMEVTINSSNRMFCTWEHNAGTPRFKLYMLSGGVLNFSTLDSVAKDNNSNTFDIYFHKENGIVLFMNENLVASDYTIGGAWTDWTTNPDIKFWTRHDAAERSDVHLHEIGFDRHPLNVHQLQSNELEELTDTFAPSGTDYMDGDWDSSGASIVGTGNPLTNLKHVRYSALADAGIRGITLDSAQDFRRFDRSKLHLRGSNAGNYNIILQTSAGNNRLSANIVLTANTWTEVDIEDIIDASWGSSGNGTLDPSSVVYVAIQNNSGGASTTDIYGLQFLSSEYDKENFVPVDWEIEDHSLVPGNYGTLYMGPGEKGRFYTQQWDGHIWMDQAEVSFLDLWGSGLKGIGTWQSVVRGCTFKNESDASENDWLFDGGSWNILSNTLSHVHTKNDASVQVDYSNITDPTDISLEDDGAILIDHGNVHYLYCGTATEGTTIRSIPVHWESITLKAGRLNIDSATDKTLTNKLIIDSGTTFAVRDGFIFYYRDLENNGTLDTGAGFGGDLSKYDRYQMLPPMDKMPGQTLDKPVFDVDRYIGG